MRSLGRLCGEKLLTPKITEEGRKGREEILEREEGLHCFAHKRPEASWQCKRKADASLRTEGQISPGIIVPEIQLAIWSEFLFGKLHFESQRIGDAVGEVREAGQQVQVDDFAVGEVLFQGREVSIGDSMRLFRQLLDVAQGGLFFRSEAGDIAFL